jgi:hypothetical protein
MTRMPLGCNVSFRRNAAIFYGRSRHTRLMFECSRRSDLSHKPLTNEGFIDTTIHYLEEV